jgi:hypothetical protein
MFYLSRKHFIHEPFYVINLVGIASENMGWHSAKLVLQHGNLTPEQLEQFAKDLDSLPRRMVLYSEMENFLPYSGLPIIQNSADKEMREIFGLKKSQPITNMESFFLWLFDDSTDGTSTTIPRYLTLLPFDRNIAGKRITEINNSIKQRAGYSARSVNSTVAKKYYESRDNVLMEKRPDQRKFWNLLRVPLIRTRSQLLADYMFDFLTPAMQAADNALDRANTQLNLLRLAVALERYKSAHGDYPATLDALVPAFLEEVPLDPFTGRKTLVYKLAPDEETAVLLHSSQWDATGKDSRYKDLFVRLAGK